TCETCGSTMTVREGRRGYSLGCANFPKCKGTREPGERTLEKVAAVTGRCFGLVPEFFKPEGLCPDGKILSGTESPRTICLRQPQVRRAGP
ncbi:topoisomerase DNA-binding C4 zinc finger domain-containing protein, partial [Singulisphaera rosea]